MYIVFVFESALIPFIVTMTSALILNKMHKRRARRRQVPLSIVIRTAAIDAVRRGHSKLSRDQLLWTVLDLPEVAAAWTARGWPVMELRKALDARLNRLEAPGPTAKQAAEFAALLRRHYSAAARFTGSAREVTRATLSLLVRDLLAREADADDSLTDGDPHYPYETFSLDSMPSSAAKRELPQDAPYRSVPLPPQADVVFWNDARTTMNFVIDVLSQVFGMSRTRAVYLMLIVHERGRAVVWSSDRAEAERLAAEATSRAREKGLPLRVGVEGSVRL